MFPSFSSRALSTVHNAVRQSVRKRKWRYRKKKKKKEILSGGKKRRKIRTFTTIELFSFLRSAATRIAEAIYAGTCESHDAIDNNRHDRHGALLFVGLAVVPPRSNSFPQRSFFEQSITFCQFSSPRSGNNELRASSFAKDWREVYKYLADQQLASRDFTTRYAAQKRENT